MVSGKLRPTMPASEPQVDSCPGLGARPHVDVTIPRTTIGARMRLVGRSEALAITQETRSVFRVAGLLDEQGRVVGVAGDDWNAEIAVRFLAVAVRDPVDVAKPLAELAEWRACDDDQIEGLWSVYRDLREQLDPLGDHNTSISAADVAMIEASVKKKDSAILMSFGLRKLVTYLTTLDAPPAT
jgi:hypothetical protein